MALAVIYTLIITIVENNNNYKSTQQLEKEPIVKPQHQLGVNLKYILEVMEFQNDSNCHIECYHTAEFCLLKRRPF